MAAGGALVLAGSVIAIAYGVGSRRWHQALARALDDDTWRPRGSAIARRDLT